MRKRKKALTFPQYVEKNFKLYVVTHLSRLGIRLEPYEIGDLYPNEGDVRPQPCGDWLVLPRPMNERGMYYSWNFVYRFANYAMVRCDWDTGFTSGIHTRWWFYRKDDDGWHLVDERCPEVREAVDNALMMRRLKGQ